jgi:citrate lyase subunit beta/citryl-CoA lyase
MLYVPAADERKLAKLPSLRGAGVILDLEDSVTSEAKERARSNATGAIATRPPVQVWVRINGLDTDLWEADLSAVVRAGLVGLIVPKVESSQDLERLSQALRALPEPRLELGIVPTIETAQGVLAAAEIAAAPGVRHLGFGPVDLSLDLGLDWPPPDGRSPTLVWAKIQLVVASRAANIGAPHDGVYARYEDLDGLRRDAELARELGFGGKHAIHPAQVPVINEVFQPSAEDIERARRVVAAYEAAESRGLGSASLEGSMIDAPVAERARRTLAAAGENVR